jgi:hypothetical protein
MADWQIKIEAWPHSSGNGADKDQAACGWREKEFVVRADDFDAAHTLAKAIVAGVRSNPAVWQAPITSIAMKTA